MEDYSKREKKTILFWSWFCLFAIIVIIIIVISGLTTFESEILTCSGKENNCSVEKINMFGMKFNKNIAKYSEIKEAGYRKDRVKGNRYAKGYTAFILTLTKKNDFTVDVFSGIYFEPSDILKDVRFLNEKIKNNSDILLKKVN